MFFDHKIFIIDITILCLMITFCNSYDVICVLMYLISLEILYHKFLYNLLHIKPTVTLNLLLRCNHEKLCTFSFVWVVCHVHLSFSSCYETLIILFCFFFIQFLLQWNVFVCGKVVLQKRRTNICCVQRAMSLSNKYWRAK